VPLVAADRGAPELATVQHPALLEFRGFPGRCARSHGQATPALLLWIPVAGEPQAMADRLMEALISNPVPIRFPATCLALRPAPWSPIPKGRAELLCDAGIVSHYYRLLRRRGGPGELRLECWRLYGPRLGWQRRCGPLSLRAFLRHYASRSAGPNPYHS
jgi:hypothetical protein